MLHLSKGTNVELRVKRVFTAGLQRQLLLLYPSGCNTSHGADVTLMAERVVTAVVLSPFALFTPADAAFLWC